MRWTSRGPGLWWYILIGAVCLLLVFFVLSKSHNLIETSVTIQGTPEQVWGVLADTAAYPEWNPFIKSIDGELVEGGKLTVTLEPPGGPAQTVEPQVTSLMPGKELRWLGIVGPPRFFEAAHYFVIDTVDQPEGTVKFVHGEDFRGVMITFLAKMLQRKIKPGFEQMNEALKARVEALNPALLPGSAVGFLCSAGQQ
jgi:hypothetical protein